MLKYPRTYEEAKQLLIAAADDDVQKTMSKRELIRLVVVNVIVVGIAIAYGIIERDVTLGVMSLVVCAMIAAPFTLAYISRNSTRRDLRNGKYFQRYTEREVLENAWDYVGKYNEFIAKQSKRRKQ